MHQITCLDEEPEELITPTSRTSTPSQFMSVSHYKQYIPELEDRFARREMAKRKRIQSNASIRSTSSFGHDEEVSTILGSKKRRGRRPKSAGGLPKVITKNIRRVLSENARPNSSLSDLSCLSYTRAKKRARTPKLIYGNDNEILRPGTRSSNRMVFYCPNCLREKNDLIMYTAHMIAYHDCKAFYKCQDCGMSLMNEDHLMIHQKIHYYSVMCTICGEKQDNVIDLQKHIDEHIQYSVQCPHCDLAFLRKHECNLHIFNQHRGKTVKRKIRQQHIIKEVRSYVSEEDNLEETRKGYEPVIMILDIAEKPKFYDSTFEDMDYQLRHPITSEVIKRKTSLGDDLVVTHKRPLNLNSSSNACAESDGFISDSSNISVSKIAKKKRIKPQSSRSQRYNRRGKVLSASPLENLNRIDNFNVDLLESTTTFDDGSTENEKNTEMGNDDMSGSSDSGSIQTEMHYLDGDTVHINLSL